MTRIRIGLVDDHPVVRVGVSELLKTQPDFACVAEAEDVPTACQLLESMQPDVLLLDLRIPGGGGLEVLRFIQRNRFTSRTLVLTTYEEDGDIARALTCGALGYLLKDAKKDLLFSAIRAVAQGQLVLSPKLDKKRRAYDAETTLSQRELEVLRAVAREEGNRAIAKQLFISEATVKTHLQHIYAKLGCKHRTAAVLEAVRRGWLSPPEH